MNTRLALTFVGAAVCLVSTLRPARASATFRRIPATTCWAELDVSNVAWYQTDGAEVYNHSTGLSPQDIFLQCPVIDDSTLNHTSFVSLFAEGRDTATDRQFEIRGCAAQNQGGTSAICGPARCTGNSTGTTCPSVGYSGGFNLKVDLTEITRTTPTDHTDWYTYVEILMPHRGNGQSDSYLTGLYASDI